MLSREADRSGRGRTITCRRCGGLVEIVEHPA